MKLLIILISLSVSNAQNMIDLFVRDPFGASELIAIQVPMDGNIQHIKNEIVNLKGWRIDALHSIKISHAGIELPEDGILSDHGICPQTVLEFKQLCQINVNISLVFGGGHRLYNGTRSYQIIFGNHNFLHDLQLEICNDFDISHPNIHFPVVFQITRTQRNVVNSSLSLGSRSYLHYGKTQLIQRDTAKY